MISTLAFTYSMNLVFHNTFSKFSTDYSEKCLVPNISTCNAFSQDQTSFPCKKIYAVALIFKHRNRSISAEVRFCSTARSRSRNSNLITFQPKLILSLLVFLMQWVIWPLHYHKSAELTMIFNNMFNTGQQKFAICCTEYDNMP